MDENAAEAVSICIALRTISDRRGEFQGNRGACLGCVYTSQVI